VNYCSTGIDLTYPGTGGQTNATTILHTYVWNATTGIQINGAGNQVIGCNIGNVANNGYGIKFSDSGERRCNYIVGNYIETAAGSTGANGIYITSMGNTVSGNYFDWPTSGHEIQFSSSDIQTGNMIWGNYSGHAGIDAPINNQVFGTVKLGTPSANNSNVLDLISQYDNIIGFKNGDGDRTWQMGFDNSNSNFLLQQGNNAFGTGADAVLSIYPNGNVGIGQPSPTGQLEVKQPSSTGAKPVLVLDQQDTDQHFIEFKTATVYTGKTAADEYLKVKTPSGDRYIRLYS
jgi:hypothetical protein